jgi:hypothetical protein
VVRRNASVAGSPYSSDLKLLAEQGFICDRLREARGLTSATVAMGRLMIGRARTWR